MTADERIVLRAVNLMVIRWIREDERETLLALVADALPQVSERGQAGALIDPARQMLAAKTPIEWTRAVTDAGEALAKILRSDLVRAVTGHVAETLRMPA